MSTPRQWADTHGASYDDVDGPHGLFQWMDTPPLERRRVQTAPLNVRSVDDLWILTCAVGCGAQFVGRGPLGAVRQAAGRVGWGCVLDETLLAMADLCPFHAETPS